MREIRSHLVQRSDFETIKVIGRGAFGEVCLGGRAGWEGVERAGREGVETASWEGTETGLL